MTEYSDVIREAKDNDAHRWVSDVFHERVLPLGEGPVNDATLVTAAILTVAFFLARKQVHND